LDVDRRAIFSLLLTITLLSSRTLFVSSAHALLFVCCNLAWRWRQDAQALAESMGVPYLECSSKTGENVAEVFHILMKEIEKDDGLLNESEENGCAIL